MSDDLVKRLRNMRASHDGAQGMLYDAADRIKELEAKLAKAVDALHIIAVNKTKVSRLADAKFVARTALAELTGGDDD